jgi:hypothetical protein
MKKYDIMMIAIGLVWLWVIISCGVILRNAWGNLEAIIVLTGGAMACMIALWINRPPAAISEPPAPPLRK